ncbi:MAG: putative lipid II flippase FtsW [Candidatus Competibacteraceae bacterium]|jgi:cell division protein FtsW|nr:putative lipid II flippase FtsW [Candidatus Competibacteraceae bacterium]
MLNSASPQNPVSVTWSGLDPWLVLPGVMLLIMGLLMVTSASMPIAEAQLGQPFYFLIRQSIFMGIGIATAIIVLHISSDHWYRYSPWLLMLAVALLLLVLFIGKEVKGSTRWISLGPINLQPSELAKLFVLIYASGYLQRHRIALRHSLEAMIRLLIVLAGVSLLLLLEPDFGTTVVLLGTVLGLVFLAGVNLWRFATLQGLVLIAMALLIYSSDYRRARLVSFLDPWADPFNKGFQLTQSLIAIGRGELSGVGLGASMQKLFYLPEAHTDFLFAILAEELGLIGVLVIICLYAIIVGRAFTIAAQAEHLEHFFAAYLAYGIGLWLSIQALFNMGVNMGVLPTKGLTLPLLSYGGSSLIVTCAAVALLLRIELETRSADQRLQPELPARAAPELSQ